MRPDVKVKWLKALRSGKYEQADGKLYDGDNQFCCLGVLCDIYRKERKVGFDKMWDGVNFFANEEDRETLDDHDGVLPPSVVSWAGLKTESPAVRVNGELTQLSALNDSGEYSFEELAKIIEKQL